MPSKTLVRKSFSTRPLWPRKAVCIMSESERQLELRCRWKCCNLVHMDLGWNEKQRLWSKPVFRRRLPIFKNKSRQGPLRSPSLTLEIVNAKWETNLAINDCMEMNLIDFVHTYLCMWVVEIKQSVKPFPLSLSRRISSLFIMWSMWGTLRVMC